MFRTLALTENMRMGTALNQQPGADLASFASYLLQIDEGRHEGHPDMGSDYMRVPRDFLIEPAPTEPEREPAAEDGDSGDEGALSAAFRGSRASSTA